MGRRWRRAVARRRAGRRRAGARSCGQSVRVSWFSSRSVSLSSCSSSAIRFGESSQRRELLRLQQLAARKRRRPALLELGAQGRIERDDRGLQLIERLLARVLSAAPLEQQQPQLLPLAVRRAEAPAARRRAGGARPAPRRSGRSCPCAAAAAAARTRTRRSPRQATPAPTRRRRSRSPQPRTPVARARSRTARSRSKPASSTANSSAPNRRPNRSTATATCASRCVSTPIATVHSTTYPPHS